MVAGGGQRQQRQQQEQHVPATAACGAQWSGGRVGWRQQAEEWMEEAHTRQPASQPASALLGLAFSSSQPLLWTGALRSCASCNAPSLRVGKVHRTAPHLTSPHRCFLPLAAPTPSSTPRVWVGSMSSLAASHLARITRHFAQPLSPPPAYIDTHPLRLAVTSSLPPWTPQHDIEWNTQLPLSSHAAVVHFSN